MTHVLMTYPYLIPSVLLCGQFQLSKLAHMGKIEFRSVPRDALTAEDCGWADCVFMVRSDSELDVAIAKKCKKTDKKLVYVMDDDLLQVPEYISSGLYYACHEVRTSICTLLSMCDVFLSPSDILRIKYGGDKSAAIEEPSSQYPERLARSRYPVRIGFAGSIDRTDDVDALLGSVVKTLLTRFGDRISIEFLGAHPQIADDCKLRCIPYCDDYKTYQKTMEELNWDIGLAPMPQTPFHTCKHYNKFVEYAGMGLAGVFSDMVPYTRVVRDGENGLLCANTPETWITAVSRLIEDDTLRERISQNARHQAETEFSVEATALSLEREIGGILTYVAANHTPIHISPWFHYKLWLRRGWMALKRYGIRLPVVAIRKLRK